jgi:hypothetical protein
MPHLDTSGSSEHVLLPEPGVTYPLPPQLQPPYNSGE